jgi:plasmid stabilization system protein ParE
MARQIKYAIDYVDEVYIHLDFIERKYHRLIAAAIRQQLTHTPDSQTRNRKPLVEPTIFDATWELRFGPHNDFRVFYHVAKAERVVTVLAIGVKTGSRLSIGGEVFEL